ncbi:MAG: hypothetical protein J6C18_00665 [Bacteroidaceae bacterium]|nr:hypothetical protein [Bacteroidaceae bacterium]
MNKCHHKLLIAIAFLFSYISSTYAESVWTLVTDVSELSVGDTVIIVANNANFAMSTEQKADNRGQIAIRKEGIFCSVETASNNTYDIQKLILRKGKKDNTYAFYTGDGYLYAASDKENWLRTENTLSNNSSWEITITEDRTNIVAQGANTNNEMRHNNTYALFSCYNKTSTQPKDIVLYKLTDSDLIRNCTVTLSVDSIDNTETLKVGSSYTLPSEVPEVAGLDFVGWSTTPFPIGTTKTPELNNPGETVTIDDTITYYAVYAKKEEVREPTYIKIENEQSDWSGTYLIVCESEGVAFDGSLNDIDVAGNFKSVIISDNNIISNEETNASAFYISKTTDGYSLQSTSGKYLYNTEMKNQVSTSDNPKVNFISYNGDNGVYIKGTGKAENYAIRYYKSGSGSRFRYYLYSNSLPIQLYKLNQTSSAYTYYTTSLNIEVTANKYGYSTWYSTVPVNIPEGLNAYYCTIEESTIATLHPISGIIPSSTAAILYSSEAATTQSSKTYTLSYTNATTENVSGNHLIGYTEDTEVNNGVSHYALNALNGIVGFYVPKTAIGDNPTPKSAFIAKAGKAYLSINPNEAPISYAIKRVDETDINPTIETMPRCEMQIYDLFGRPIKHAGKGIYITNGKKVFF